MNFTIERIDSQNYPLFGDMVFWRENGFERKPLHRLVAEQIKKELGLFLWGNFRIRDKINKN